MRKKKSKKVVWEKAPDIQKRILYLTKKLDLKYIDSKRVFCFRSQYTATRAYARIWGLSRIFQLALDTAPLYVIEVISEKFDKLQKSEQDKILIHELVHIPASFSGALRPHTKRRGGRVGFEDRVRQLVGLLKV